jgi:hypothetical protein
MPITGSLMHAFAFGQWAGAAQIKHTKDSRAEPERPHDDRDAVDMREAGADLEMIGAERKARGGRKVFHRECNRNVEDEQSSRVPRTVGEGSVDKRARYENGRQRLGRWGWIPGKSDRGGKNGGDCQPKYDFCFATDGLRSTLSRVMQPIAVGYGIADSQNPMSVM